MIPYKLRLQNFMCYREEQTLDFSGIHLACLAGENGHGKSALLDAMTWALWGRARARRDDELIALGETEMWVDFEFGFGPQRYRVWRQRSKKGRGQSDLHLYIWNARDDSWQLLDEGGLLERQALIIRTLRMEYDTFVNSAFLLQGRADSFTLKTAAERKQILADILGLSRYDLYEERAKEEVRLRKDRAIGLQGEMGAIDHELGRRAEHQGRLDEARREVSVAVGALRAAETEQAASRLQVEALRGQAKQLNDLRNRLARAERDLSDARTQLVAAQARLQNFETVLAQREEIEQGWARLQQARADDAGYNARLLKHSQFQEKVSRIERAIDAARAGLQLEHRRLLDREADLGRKVTTGQEQAKMLAEAQQVLARMAEQHARRQAIAAEVRELAERLAGLRAAMDRAKQDAASANEKAQLMLAEADAAACPLCGQALTPDHRDRMLADLHAERDAQAVAFRAAQAEAKTLNERRSQLETEDADLDRQLKPRDARQRQAAQAEAAVTEGHAAAEEAAAVAQQAAAVAQRIAAEDYAPAEWSALAAVQAELAATGYNAASHAAVRAEVEKQLPFDTLYQRQLLPALDGITEARQQAETLAAAVTRREAELAEDQAARKQLEAAVTELPRLEAALNRTTTAVEQASQAERRARQREGAAMQQLDALDALEERRARLAADLDAVNAEVSVYTDLREAFGKKGLQAMIIESAIPEIETEANRLLSRMSDGRMSLRLETQREKVTGGVAETLDILIADEVGQRPYELFSGGEAFRANLSLRIAISKLLARRAGAQLQTLVVDEGFGSQDSQGRALVVEAINSIQHDFERILVITHIEELKDLFPARIDVVKTPNGSRVYIA
jgi:DNA repair protein SbcC/Rad50